MDDDAEDAGLAEAGHWLESHADRVIETHIGRVFLIKDHAYKLKKAVDFGYLDFSTRDKRAWAVDRELELNRRTAPDLYQSTHWITGRDGYLSLDGPGEPIERVLKMRRFDPDGVLDKAPGTVRDDFAEALGRQTARFHASAETVDGGADSLGYVIQSNAAHLRQLANELGAADATAAIEATDAAFERLRPLLAARGAAGQVRVCHGDLHLGNILAEDGHAVLFDCIEFNDRLSRIDVLYDVAFLLMDLVHRGQAGGANRLLNGYLDEAARTFGDQGLTGLRVLPLFMSVRAVVRCHVNAHQGKPKEAREYLAAAMAHLQPAKASLTAVGGLSGSGKTTYARRIAPTLGAPPGAVVLRSDEIRKRLWGVAPTERLPPEAYGLGTSEKVYGRLFEDAQTALAAGVAVVLDAVFLKPEERSAAEALARTAEVPFDGVWLDAPPQVMAERVAARTGDASDADVAVLKAQLERDPGVIGWRTTRA